jgi:hypothetical protein
MGVDLGSAISTRTADLDPEAELRAPLRMLVGTRGTERFGLRPPPSALVIAIIRCVAIPWTNCTFASIAWAYSGALTLSDAAWVPMSMPIAPTKESAANTVMTTAGARIILSR